MFSFNFWDKIKNHIKTFYLKFLFNTIGPNYLSKEEKDFLENNMGKKYLDYNITPLLDKIYLLGKLNQKIGLKNINKLDKKDFDEYIKKNKISIKNLDSIKKQTYLDILGKQYTIEKDLRQILLNLEMKSKLNIKEITKKIQNKLRDWNDSETSTAYWSEGAFNEGKISEMKENDSDPWVYKVPINDERTCISCKRAYLNSDGSPKLFKLSDLEKNGNNIGSKVIDYKPTLGPLHPRCRCLLQQLNLLDNTKIEDYIWNGSLYVLKDEIKNKLKVKRKSKVNIKIGNKDFEI